MVVVYLPIAIIPVVAFALYIRSVILNYLTTPFSVIYPPSVFNVTWVDNLFRVPYECWGYLAPVFIVLFIMYLWREKEKTMLYFGLAAGITWLSTLVLTLIFDPSARYAVLIAPLIIVPAMVPITKLVQRGQDKPQQTALFSGMAYIILTANLFPLIAWYTTTYHFVFK